MGKATVTPIGGGGEVQAATAATAGIVKLSDSTTSTSGAASGVAATPAAVKAAIAAAKPYTYPISGYTPVTLGSHNFWLGDASSASGTLVVVSGGVIIKYSGHGSGDLLLSANSDNGGKSFCILPASYDEETWSDTYSSPLHLSKISGSILFRVSINGNTFTKFLPCVGYTKN